MQSKSGIYFQKFGNFEASPALVLVMGYGGSSDAWPKPFLEALAKDYAVVVLDNRGTGRSPKGDPENAYSIEVFAEDLAGVLTTAGVKECHLFGWSLGGCIALEYAHQYPKNIQSLTLMSTIGGGPLYTRPPQEMLDAMVNPTGETLWDLYLCTWRQCFSEKGLQKHEKDLQAIFEESKKNLSPLTALHGHMRAYLGFDSSSWVSQLKTPTLVITGEKDRLTPPVNSEVLAKKIPGARLVKLPGEHCPHIENPEAVLQLIQSLRGA